MKIVIIGDGKVGFKLAKQLSEENYDVVLIDNNAVKLKEAINNLDVICVTGDGVSADIQIEAGVPEADLVIACASTDELNMLSCLIARRLGARHTIARVRNPIYYQQIDILKEDLRLSMAVNPEYVVANEIARVLIFPAASKVELFVKGRVELIEFPVADQMSIVGKKLSDIYRNYQIKVLVCAIQRGKEVEIPDGDFVVKDGDKLYLVAQHHQIEKFFRKIGNRKRKITKVMIGGGGRVGYYLAKQLIGLGMQVKIIEHNYEKCEDLCERLPNATIIHGDATNYDFLIEEGIGETDAFIALTGMDEENIIMGLFAKQQNVGKIVAKVNEDSRAQMIEGMGIDSVVSPKSVTADEILCYVRARQNSLKSSNVEAMYRLVDDRIEALEFLVNEETTYTQVPLKHLKLKANNIIACICRKRQIIIPGGDDCIKQGDVVVVITKEKKMQDMKDIFV